MRFFTSFGIIGAVLLAGCHALTPMHLREIRFQNEEETEMAAESSSVRSLDAAIDAISTGNDQAAITHLEEYLQLKPDQIQFRKLLIGCYLRTNNDQQTFRHYEFLLADLQSKEDTLADRIALHTSAMELAISLEQSHAEEFHRGLGFYCISQRLRQVDSENEEAEALLFKALTALKGVSEGTHPYRARAWWYTYLIYEMLEQPMPARDAYRKAREFEPFSPLTPTETVEMRLREEIVQ
ncbi:MAG: hypothetical protein R3B84_23960 [Zavarzinella sp.]